MKRAWIFAMVTAIAFTGMSAAEQGKTDQDLLQGNWQIVSIKNPVPPDPPAEVIQTMTGNIKGDMMRLAAKGTPMATFKFKLGTANKMKTIDLTHDEGPGKGTTELGIYKIEGDTLTMCWNLMAGKERPAAFAIKEGAAYSLVVFKKTK